MVKGCHRNACAGAYLLGMALCRCENILVDKAVKVAYGGDKRIIRIRNDILGNNLLNASCFKIYLGVFVPDIVAGKYAVARVYKYPV